MPRTSPNQSKRSKNKDLKQIYREQIKTEWIRRGGRNKISKTEQGVKAKSNGKFKTRMAIRIKTATSFNQSALWTRKSFSL